MAAAEVGVVDADAAAAVGSVVEQSALSSSTSSWWASVHSRSRIWANTKKKKEKKKMTLSRRFPLAEQNSPLKSRPVGHGTLAPLKGRTCK